jgi:hypothetical protein
MNGENGTRIVTTQSVRRAALVTLMATCCAFFLASCKSGTTTDLQQSCKSEGGFLAGRKVTCTGSVGTVRGEPSIGVIDADGDLSGNYKLVATITVGKGEAKAYVDTADGEEAGGKVSPDKPLRIGAVVDLDEEDEDVSVNIKVLGKVVEDLRYEARVVPQG